MSEIKAQTFKIHDAESYNSLTGEFDRFTERLTRPLALRLIAMAEIAPHENVLDVGTGTGVVALQAAQMIDSGQVTGIDLSEEMLNRAREKAIRLKVENKTTFSRMDAEALNFEDHKFDAVVSLFALLHFPDPLKALEEMHRVLRPGGRMAIGVGSGVPVLSWSAFAQLAKKIPDALLMWQKKQLVAPHFLNSLVKKQIVETDEPDESDLAGHTHHYRTQAIVSLVKKAGFKIAKTDWQGHKEIIDSPEEFWEIQRTFSSIARKRLSKAGAEEVESLRGNFLEQCREVRKRGGQLVYPFGAFYVVANKRE